MLRTTYLQNPTPPQRDAMLLVALAQPEKLRIALLLARVPCACVTDLCTWLGGEDGPYDSSYMARHLRELLRDNIVRFTFQGRYKLYHLMAEDQAHPLLGSLLDLLRAQAYALSDAERWETLAATGRLILP